MNAFLQIMELFHEELDTPIDSKFNFSKSEVSAICFCEECKQFTRGSCPPKVFQIQDDGGLTSAHTSQGLLLLALSLPLISIFPTATTVQ